MAIDVKQAVSAALSYVRDVFDISQVTTSALRKLSLPTATGG